MSSESHLNERSGMLAGGNWIIDQVKIIDVIRSMSNWPISSISRGTRFSYNVLLDLLKWSRFALEGRFGRQTASENTFWRIAEARIDNSLPFHLNQHLLHRRHDGAGRGREPFP